jgi:hypothetical protein
VGRDGLEPEKGFVQGFRAEDFFITLGGFFMNYQIGI